MSVEIEPARGSITAKVTVPSATHTDRSCLNAASASR